MRISTTETQSVQRLVASVFHESEWSSRHFQVLNDVRQHLAIFGNSLAIGKNLIAVRVDGYTVRFDGYAVRLNSNSIGGHLVCDALQDIAHAIHAVKELVLCSAQNLVFAFYPCKPNVIREHIAGASLIRRYLHSIAQLARASLISSIEKRQIRRLYWHDPLVVT